MPVSTEFLSSHKVSEQNSWAAYSSVLRISVFVVDQNQPSDTDIFVNFRGDLRRSFLTIGSKNHDSARREKGQASRSRIVS